MIKSLKSQPDTQFQYLETDRLFIRRMKLSDAESLFQYRADPEVARYQYWESFTREDAIQFVKEQQENHPNRPGQWIQLGIELKASGQLVGDCAFISKLDQPSEVNIGATLSRRFQNQGIASEAIRALLDYLFDRFQKHRVVAITDARNTSSIQLVKRLKFRQEGHFIENTFFKGAWCDEYQFAMLEREWREMKKL